MKHVLKREEVLQESLGRGSVVFVKGDKKKLYVTQVTGHSEIKPGVQMLFLGGEFYRVKKDDDRLKAVRVLFKNEDELRKSIKVNSAGMVYVVRNNNKTPWHWESTKHTRIDSALKALESRILGDDYLVESNQNEPDSARPVEEMVGYDTVRSAFFGENLVDILSYSDNSTFEKALEKYHDDSGDGEIEWELTIEVLLADPKYDSAVKSDRVARKVEVLFVFESSFFIYSSYDPGDYYTPPYSEWEARDITTKLLNIYVDGTEVSLDETDPDGLSKKFSKLIKEMTGDYMTQYLDRNYKPSWYASFFT